MHGAIPQAVLQVKHESLSHFQQIYETLREKKAGKLKNAAKITLKIRTFSHPQDI
jgi:hypothetical protein